MKTWLLVDCHYLAHRAWHTTGGLEYQGSPTGVLFGVLRDVSSQIELHEASLVILAFDSPGLGHRGALDPNYKSSRRNKDLDEEERESLRLFREQLKRLRTEIFPEMGFKNIFQEKGFEADDIIAEVAENIPVDHEAVILSADKDLYQCLSANVRMFNPTTKKIVTLSSFREEWGVEPAQWAQVKAIAGCNSDDVVGVRGVGEKTAAKFVAGVLKPGKKYDDIINNLDITNKNMPLVKLPFLGLEIPDIREDEFSIEGKRLVEEKLGIRRRKTRSKSELKRKTIQGGFDL